VYIGESRRLLQSHCVSELSIQHISATKPNTCYNSLMIKMFNLLFQMNALVYAGLEDIARFKHLCLGLSTLLADMTD